MVGIVSDGGGEWCACGGCGEWVVGWWVGVVGGGCSGCGLVGRGEVGTWWVAGGGVLCMVGGTNKINVSAMPSPWIEVAIP